MRITVLAALFLLSAAGVRPEPIAPDLGDSVGEILNQSVPEFVVQNQEARTVLDGIGQSFGLPIVVDPDVSGLVSLQIRAASLASILDAICEPKGWSYEIVNHAYLLVRRFVVRIYPVDYLPMAQTGSSTASVSLSDSLAGGSGAVAGANGLPQANATQGQLTLGGSAGSTSGNSSLSLAVQNDADFWGKLETDIRAMTGEGETVLINRFAGLVQLRGSMKTQTMLAAYLDRVMERVGRQARISVRIVEVDLNNQSKAGIDWSLASSSIGRILNKPVSVSNVGVTTSSLPQVGAVGFDGNTFTGTIGLGGIQATINALSEQGTVRVESKPEISALNNQTAFVQISEDQPYFSRYNTTTINAGGSGVSGTQPITNTNFSQSTVSFGNLLEITVQIADDLSTKLSLCPAVTELKGTVTSPDGQETAPITGTKRARTTISVRNHETAVIGGFITETKGSQARGIPGLDQIPLLGRAFSTKGTALARTELVFLVTVNAENPFPLSRRSIDPEATDGLPLALNRMAPGASAIPVIRLGL